MRVSESCLVAFIAVVSCKDEPKTVVARPGHASTPKVEPAICETYLAAVARLGECAKLDRKTFDTIASEVTAAKPYGEGTLRKCQMTLHLLHDDLELDCPELAREIPDAEIPF